MLTQRQTEVFDYIQDTMARTGSMPSTREIQTHFKYASQTSVMDILAALEKKGVINRRPGKARALQLTGTIFRAITNIPIYGTIPAGFPADQTQENEGCLAVDLEALGLPNEKNVFALRVQGDSMIGAGILPGDTVVMTQRQPRSNDIVAALIDGEVTLKRYLLTNGKPFLRAENTRYPDLIPAHELIVQGVQIALFRISKTS